MIGRTSMWLLAAGAMLAAAVASGRAVAANGPVVVELFTSQGCASCPPADRFLGELKHRDDVLALSLHVTYWDDLGWDDPYGKNHHTRRQRAYNARFDRPNIYTPQMVVDGRYQAVGSHRDEVRQRIASARADGDAVRPRIARTDDGARLTVPASGNGPASVWPVTYDARHETDVGRGENAGDTVVNHNVVRSWRKLGTYTGERFRHDLDMDRAREAGRDGCAVLVQAHGDGPILGAAALTLDGAS